LLTTARPSPSSIPQTTSMRPAQKRNPMIGLPEAVVRRGIENRSQLTRGHGTNDGSLSVADFRELGLVMGIDDRLHPESIQLEHQFTPLLPGEVERRAHCELTPAEGPYAGWWVATLRASVR
jgi:hypothetical protein